MLRRAVLVATLWSWAWAAPPTPREHFGFNPGDDYKLANYREIISYFEKLAASSDRIQLREFGKTSLGKPMYAAFLSAPENLKKLAEYQRISQALTHGQATAEQAAQMVRDGKVFVWIDSGLHASEIAPAQHSPHLAYRVITEETDEMRRIRQNVILIQIPVINPDGLDMIAEWYLKNVGTPHEVAPLPALYQKYAGHDNNRDYFMLNLDETKHVTRMLFQEWFPQIVYNQHQSAPFPARIFVPPYAEPLNPHIQAPLMEGINFIGAAIKERMAKENKPGVLSYLSYDAWWNGGLRSVPAFHNMHGILTETAGYTYATPQTYKASEFPERFASGVPTTEPSIFYQRPWMGGVWRNRDAIDYMLTVDMAILDLAATRSEQFLRKAYDMARAAIDLGNKGGPYAYIVSPKDQWDAPGAVDMLRRLSLAGVEIRRSKAEFRVGDKMYPAGTWVVPAAQPFRAYVVDLLEPQRYPELRAGQSGPTKRPYDIAGWTLSMQMGVRVDRVDDRFAADLEDVVVPAVPGSSSNHRENLSFVTTAELLASGKRVRWAADGAILTEGDASFNKAAYELKPPRVAVYDAWAANLDSGWTQFLLDTYKTSYKLLRNADVQAGSLSRQFDTIILPSQRADSILHGTRSGERPPGRAGAEAVDGLQRPEYTGGIGLAGLDALDEFVRDGGTLIALDQATELAINYFGLPVRALLSYGGEGEGSSAFYCPGSLLRINIDTTHPLGFGMPEEAIAMSTGGQAFEIRLLPQFNKGDSEVRSVARYADKNLLASGWLSGERAVLGRHILLDARHGKGRVVLFGFRPQFRAQPHGTFKLLLNAIYLGSAAKL